MIKGLERKIMLLKGASSKYFDEAYFIMKDDISIYDEGEILRAAERIMFSAESGKRIKKSSKRMVAKSILFSLLFALGGFGLGLSLAFLI